MKKCLAFAWGFLVLCAVLPADGADRAYPTRTVTIVVPASAGTGADVVARLVAQRLAEVWGQPVVVENKEGASGSIGAAQVAKDWQVYSAAFDAGALAR